MGQYTTGHTNHPAVVVVYSQRWQDLFKPGQNNPDASEVWGSFSVCPVCSKSLLGYNGGWRGRAVHIKNCVVHRHYRTNGTS